MTPTGLSSSGLSRNWRLGVFEGRRDTLINSATDHQNAGILP